MSSRKRHTSSGFGCPPTKLRKSSPNYHTRHASVRNVSRQRRRHYGDNRNDGRTSAYRGRRNKIHGKNRERIRREGRGRKKDIVWVSDDKFYSKPSDLAIAYGFDPAELKQRLWNEMQSKTNEEALIKFLHGICQSPYKYCARNVFKMLWEEKVFEQEDIRDMLEEILTRTLTDEKDNIIFQIGNVVKCYCSFFESIGHVDNTLQTFLCRLETLVKQYNSQCLRYMSGIQMFAVESNLDLVLQPGIPSLYNRGILGARKTTDSFENSRNLLQQTFALFREDITRPLLSGLRKLRHFLKGNPNPEKFRNDDIRVYHQVQIICSFASFSNGLIWQIQLDTNQPLVKSIMRRRKRVLQIGTLISLSTDSFKRHIIYGAVAGGGMESEMTRKGIVYVEFSNDFNGNTENTGQMFTLAESKSNCLSYLGALAAIKTQLDEDKQLPFEKQIVHLQQNTEPPNYFSCDAVAERGVSFDYSKAELKDDALINPKDEKNIVKDLLEQMVSNVCADIAGIHIIETERFPSPQELGMDISQYRAFSDGLTQGLTLIQGPPGTGKTVMALKLLEVFLNNKRIWSKSNDGPIVILSYTNHALDQFLEGILRIPKMSSASPQKIIRVGSRCKTSGLDKYNLSYRRKENKTYTQKMANSILSQNAKHHKRIESAIKTYRTSLVHEDCLMDVIPHYLFMSLKLHSHANHTLCHWLDIFSDDFVREDSGSTESVDATDNIEEDDDTVCEKLGLGIDRKAPEFEDTDSDVPKILRPNPIVIAETNKTKALLLEIQRRIMRTKPMSAEKERHISNVWNMSVTDRWRLYTLWVNKIVKMLNNDMITADIEYRNAYGMYKECQHFADINIFRNAQIVAMTTTRAAMDHAIFRRINPKIVIIEEAAEVPNHHILACLYPSLQHLVMIGDHQQLRPSYNDYKTAKRYDLDVSIFERLVTSGLPFQQLQFQHRMRPEISDLLTPSIYKELHNHASVVEIEDVRGMERNVYFLNHNVKEHADSDKDLKSHKNQHEVDFIAKLYRYLRLQGYGSRDITVLTTYKEQERHLKIAIRDVEKTEHFYEVTSNSSGNDRDIPGSSTAHLKSRCIMEDKNARVTTVDNFQGEENKIILLSLVRSNSKGNIGFLRESNRICVALSRAKAGLYVIGDCTLLREKNDLWRKILQKADSKGIVGPSLTLRCRNHPQNTTEVSHANDFQNVEDGGCSLKCSAKLICGHDCPKMCHTYDPNHNTIKCCLICEKPCPFGHKCQFKCWECQKECKACKVKVLKTLPKCGHTVTVPCSKKLDDYSCTKRCERKLECGHQCQKKCGIPCNTIDDCNELIKAEAECGHMVQTACHTKDNPICKVKCSKKLECGHFCKGSCQSCFGGHLHQKCREKIRYTRQCGHTVTIDCPLGNWSQRYGRNLPKCQEQCTWRCDHTSFEMKCGEKCEKQPCNLRCKTRVRCGHLCELLYCDHNGEHWCRRCSKQIINGGLGKKQHSVRNPHHIRLQGCGCVFETEVLDQYLLDNKSFDVPRCPNCQNEINDKRYYNYIWNGKISRSGALLAAESALEELKTKWRELGYSDISHKIDNDIAKGRLILVSQSKEDIRLQRLLVEHISCIGKLVKGCISQISVRWNCESLIEGLCDRLKKDRIVLSFQELWEIAPLVSKLISSLKCYIVRSKLKNKCITAELCSLLNESGHIFSSRFQTVEEEIRKLEPVIFCEADIIVKNVIEPGDNYVHKFTSKLT